MNINLKLSLPYIRRYRKGINSCSGETKITCRINPRTKQKVKDIADSFDMTVGGLVKYMLEELIKEIDNGRVG